MQATSGPIHDMGLGLFEWRYHFTLLAPDVGHVDDFKGADWFSPL